MIDGSAPNLNIRNPYCLALQQNKIKAGIYFPAFICSQGPLVTLFVFGIYDVPLLV